MNLTEFTISNIKEFVSGDNNLTPKLTGPKIISLFNSVGVRDIYNRSDGGMPRSESRNEYINNTLKTINNSKSLVKLIEIVFNQSHFASDTSKDIDLAVSKFNSIIQADGYKIQKIADRYKIIGSTLPDEIEVTIHFEEIQAEIIKEIKNAKYLIWLAVAWITDKVLLRELYKKQQEGLNVQIIMIDDEINRSSGVEFEKHFNVKRVQPKGVYQNLMHHKFCIIDLKAVIHGSYNWTNKAQWNNETISIDYSKEIAEKFADQFVSLKK